MLMNLIRMSLMEDIKRVLRVEIWIGKLKYVGDFDSCLQPDDFIDWAKRLDQYIEWKEMPKYEKSNSSA